MIGPGQPVHEPAASPARARDPGGDRRVRRRWSCSSCNVATQPGETGGFDLADHVEALARHGAGHLPDVVLANNRFDAAVARGLDGRARPLRWPPAVAAPGPASSSMTSSIRPTRTITTPERLAAAVMARLGARGRPPAPVAPGARRSHGLSGAGCPRPTATSSPRCAPRSPPSTRPARATASRRSPGWGRSWPPGSPRSPAWRSVSADMRAPDRRVGGRRAVPAAGAGVRLGGLAGPLPLGLAARPVPRPRIAEPRRRPRAPRVRRAGRRGARSSRRAWRRSACRRRGASGAATGS